MRRPILLAAALAVGLGAALVIVSPAAAAGNFTAQVDTTAALYPGGPITWSGEHDAAGTLAPTWYAIVDGGDPEGIDLAPACSDTTTGADPVGYTCTLDPVALAPGSYTLVGQLTGEGQPLQNVPAPFTIADPATLAVSTSPVHAGDVVQFGGTRIATGGMSDFRVDGDLIAQDSCTGATGSATTWSCLWTSPTTLGVGPHTLAVSFVDSRSEEATDLSTTFDVAATPLTIQIDTDPVYRDSPTLEFSGTRPGAGSLSFQLETGSQPAVTIDQPSCPDTESDTTWDCFWTPEGLQLGPATLIVTYSDVYSQSQTTDVDFTVVPEPPTIVSAAQQPGMTVEVSGTSADGFGTIHVREGSTELCTAFVDGEQGAPWSCTTGALSAGAHTVTATESQSDTVESPAGEPFDFTVAAQQSPTYQIRPGGLTVTGLFVGGDEGGSDVLDLYQWLDRGDGWGAGDTPVARCADGESGDGVVQPVFADDGTASCSFDLAPGIWIPYIDATATEAYLVVPATPAAPTLSDNGDSTAHAAGVGAPGDLVTVLDGAGSTACTATVASTGAWACTTGALSVGPHAFHALEQNVTAIPCDGTGSIPCPDAGEGGPLDYIRGGMSAASAASSVAIAAPPVPPTTPLITPVWTFSIDGIDTANMHPGDTFTASGSGLPAGATVTFVLHSTPVTLGQTVVAPDGSFTFQGTIPLDTEPGAHQIIATLSGTGLASTNNAKDVTVSAVVPASDDQSGAGDQTDSGSATDSGGTHEGGVRPEVAPNVLTNGLHSIGDVLNHPQKVPAAIAIGLVLLVLGILPAHLLDATLAEQWERVGRRFPRLAKRPGWFERLHAMLERAPAIGGLTVTTVTAVLFCFADPRFGFNLESLRLIIALAVALFIVTYVVDWITQVIVRGAWNAEVTIQLRPLGLLLALVGVIVSRALDFSPGFLIGLVLGLSISGRAAGRYAWRAILVRTGLVLGVALAAWIGFSAFSGDAAEHDFTSALLLELLVAIATEGIVALLIELLPFHLLEGERVFQRSKIVWGLAYLLTIVVFIVAVVPWEGNWAQLGSGLWAWLGILIAFAIAALGTYLFFRVRSRREHEVEKDVAEDESVAIGED